MPLDVVKAKCAPYLAYGKPAKHKALISSSDHAIVATYGAVYRGIVRYYLLAGDVHRLHKLRWGMETSLLKTWQPSTARRCRRWPRNTAPRPRHHAGSAPASKPASSEH